MQTSRWQQSRVGVLRALRQVVSHVLLERQPERRARRPRLCVLKLPDYSRRKLAFVQHRSTASIIAAPPDPSSETKQDESSFSYFTNFNLFTLSGVLKDFAFFKTVQKKYVHILSIWKTHQDLYYSFFFALRDHLKSFWFLQMLSRWPWFAYRIVSKSVFLLQ